MIQLTPRLVRYLQSWHKTSTTRQKAKGNAVELSYTQFLSLFTDGQLLALEWAAYKGSLGVLQNEESKDALVLTWRSYDAVCSKLFNVNTAFICTREMSAQVCRMKAGDNHTPTAKKKIGAAQKGKPKSAAHKAKISQSTKGKPKAGWSPERRAARSALIAAKKAKGGK